jgi:hypothetical protein
MIVPSKVVPEKVPPTNSGPENPEPAVMTVPDIVDSTVRASAKALVPVVTTSPKFVMVGITNT